MLVAGSAQARTETLQWTHPDPSTVASFEVHVGTGPGQSDVLTQNLGTPVPDASGIYSFTINLSTEETVFVRLTALDASSNQSDASNEIQRSVAIGIPGQPQVILP